MYEDSDVGLFRECYNSPFAFASGDGRPEHKIAHSQDFHPSVMSSNHIKNSKSNFNRKDQSAQFKTGNDIITDMDSLQYDPPKSNLTPVPSVSSSFSMDFKEEKQPCKATTSSVPGAHQYGSPPLPKKQKIETPYLIPLIDCRKFWVKQSLLNVKPPVTVAPVELPLPPITRTVHHRHSGTDERSVKSDVVSNEVVPQNVDSKSSLKLTSQGNSSHYDNCMDPLKSNLSPVLSVSSSSSVVAKEEKVEKQPCEASESSVPGAYQYGSPPLPKKPKIEKPHLIPLVGYRKQSFLNVKPPVTVAPVELSLPPIARTVHHRSSGTDERSVKSDAVSNEVVPQNTDNKSSLKSLLSNCATEITSSDKTDHLTNKASIVHATHPPLSKNSITNDTIKAVSKIVKDNNTYVRLNQMSLSEIDDSKVAHQAQSTKVSKSMVDSKRFLEATPITNHQALMANACDSKNAVKVPDLPSVSSSSRSKHAKQKAVALHNSHSARDNLQRQSHASDIDHTNDSSIPPSVNSQIQLRLPQEVPKPANKKRYSQGWHRNEKRSVHFSKDEMSNNNSSMPPDPNLQSVNGIKITIPNNKIILSGAQQNQKLMISDNSPSTSLRTNVKSNSPCSRQKLVIAKDENASSYSAMRKTEKASHKRKQRFKVHISQSSRRHHERGDHNINQMDRVPSNKAAVAAESRKCTGSTYHLRHSKQHNDHQRCRASGDGRPEHKIVHSRDFHPSVMSSNHIKNSKSNFGRKDSLQYDNCMDPPKSNLTPVPSVSSSSSMVLKEKKQPREASTSSVPRAHQYASPAVDFSAIIDRLNVFESKVEAKFVDIERFVVERTEFVENTMRNLLKHDFQECESSVLASDQMRPLCADIVKKSQHEITNVNSKCRLNINARNQIEQIRPPILYNSKGHYTNRRHELLNDIVFGTGVNSMTLRCSDGSGNRRLLINKLHPDTTTEEICDVLKKLNIRFRCEMLETHNMMHYASFVVTCHSSHFHLVAQSQLWPVGINLMEFRGIPQRIIGDVVRYDPDQDWDVYL